MCPIAYVQKGSAPWRSCTRQPGGAETTVVNVVKKNRYLINPGSIGQPRDTDPQSLLRDLRFQENSGSRVRRVPYRIDLAQQRITEAGLP